MPTTATIEREALSPQRAATGVRYAVESVERADGPRASTRAHRRLETVIHVHDGVVYVSAADDEAVLLPGDETTVPAGVPYRRWNAGDAEARFTETFRAV